MCSSCILKNVSIVTVSYHEENLEWQGILTSYFPFMEESWKRGTWNLILRDTSFWPFGKICCSSFEWWIGFYNLMQRSNPILNLEVFLMWKSVFGFNTWRVFITEFCLQWHLKKSKRVRVFLRFGGFASGLTFCCYFWVYNNVLYILLMYNPSITA